MFYLHIKQTPLLAEFLHRIGQGEGQTYCSMTEHFTLQQRSQFTEKCSLTASFKFDRAGYLQDGP